MPLRVISRFDAARDSDLQSRVLARLQRQDHLGLQLARQ